MDDRPRTIEFIYFDAGGGHAAALRALTESIKERYPGWKVVPVNLQKLLLPVDPVYRLTNVSSENVYNAMLRGRWTTGSKAMLRGLQQGIRLYAPSIEKKLAQHWGDTHPDLVVSLIPNFNAVLFRALKNAHPDVPYVTVMTDIVDLPPKFWQEKQDQYMICCSDVAFLQAKKLGLNESKIFKTSGVPLRPSFYSIPAWSPAAVRADLNLDPHRLTALIMFGGNGAAISLKIVDRLNAADLGLQTIVLCGRNEALQKDLQGKAFCHPVGFTEEVPAIMDVCQIFIGKPGPASISEAGHKGLAVIVEHNRKTLPQEAPNTQWLVERGFGLVIKDFKLIGPAVAYLQEGDRLARFQENAQSLQNKGVFEIPQFLNTIMDREPALTHSRVDDARPLKPQKVTFASGAAPPR